MPKPSIARHIVTTALAFTLLAPVACGRERKLKECAERCDVANRECEHRHDRECGERMKRCAEACERI